MRGFLYCAFGINADVCTQNNRVSPSEAAVNHTKTSTSFQRNFHCVGTQTCIGVSGLEKGARVQMMLSLESGLEVKKEQGMTTKSP